MPLMKACRARSKSTNAVSHVRALCDLDECMFFLSKSTVSYCDAKGFCANAYFKILQIWRCQSVICQVASKKLSQQFCHSSIILQCQIYIQVTWASLLSQKQVFQQWNRLLSAFLQTTLVYSTVQWFKCLVFTTRRVLSQHLTSSTIKDLHCQAMTFRWNHSLPLK